MMSEIKMAVHTEKTKRNGFALIEVLIAVFVLAVGILGAGAMQTMGLQANQGAANRAQAMFLASDMMDRIRANRAAINAYVDKNTADAVTKALSRPSCLDTANGCAAANIAQADIVDWVDRIERDNLLPSAHGTIRRVSAGSNDIRVTITWGETDWNGGARTVATMSYDIVATVNPLNN